MKPVIPKIIHQVWIGPHKPPLEHMMTWREKNPDFEYILWDEAKLQELFPNGLICQNQYEQMPIYAGKSDVLRYEILYHFGGFYADADCICFRKFEDFLFENDSFAAYENEWMCGMLIGSSCIGATKNNRLMKLVMDEIAGMDYGPDSDLANVNPVKTTGPRLLTKIAFDNEYTPLTIYPSWFFYPHHLTGFTYKGRGKPFADHYWHTGKLLDKPKHDTP